MTLWQVYLAILCITAAEGGLNTIYPPFLEKSRYTIEQIGLIVALFGVTQLAARLPAGALYGAGRAKPLFITFVVLFILSTIGFAYADGAIFLLTLTLLHGFAFGAIGTIMLAWTIELKPANSSHGATMGWYTAALSAGYSIGSFGGGYLADHLGFAFTFLGIGVIPVLSILVGLTLPTPTVPLVPPPVESGKPRNRWSLKELRGVVTRNLVLATLIAFYLNLLDDGFAAFFPLFGLSVGMSLTFIGFLKGLKSLMATGLRPMAGLVFRYINFKTLNNLLIIAWALVMIVVPSLREPWMFALVFIVIGVCRGLLRVTSATMIAEEKARDTRGIGIASGLYNAGLDAGAFAGPLVAGLVASVTDIPTMFRIVPLALLAVYFPVALWVGRTQLKSQDEASV